MIVQTINEYSIENDPAGTWKLNIIDRQNLLTDDTIEKLKDFKETIFFNDLSGKHWIFDFKVNDVWFEAKKIDCCKMTMILNAYN